MSREGPIKLYEWIVGEFTVEGAEERVRSLAPHLKRLVEPRDRVLDICCGAGAFAFYLEEQGANVTGVDGAPFMIRLAREEAARRGSAVEFILADALAHNPVGETYDAAVFLGNTVSDFPPAGFAKLAANVHGALKQQGRFAVHYVDGVHRFANESYPREGVEREEPERLTRRFKGYLPDKGAYVEVYTNEARGESYEYTSYVYTLPVVQSLMAGMFDLEESVRLGERSFLDVFRKR